jgi:hypothetical protein
MLMRVIYVKAHVHNSFYCTTLITIYNFRVSLSRRANACLLLLKFVFLKEELRARNWTSIQCRAPRSNLSCSYYTTLIPPPLSLSLLSLSLSLQANVACSSRPLCVRFNCSTRVSVVVHERVGGGLDFAVFKIDSKVKLLCSPRT